MSTSMPTTSCIAAYARNKPGPPINPDLNPDLWEPSHLSPIFRLALSCLVTILASMVVCVTLRLKCAIMHIHNREEVTAMARTEQDILANRNPDEVAAFDEFNDTEEEIDIDPSDEDLDNVDDDELEDDLDEELDEDDLDDEDL